MKIVNIIKRNPFTFIIILIALIVSLLTIMYSIPVGLTEIGCVCFVAFISFRWYLKDQKRKIEQVHSLCEMLRLSDDDKTVVGVFPLPTALIKSNGELVWFNALFEEVLHDFSKMENNNLCSVIPLHTYLSEDGTAGSFEVSGDKGCYTVYPAALKEDAYALYFVNDTVLKNIRTSYMMTRPVVLLINVDSLEQAEDLMPHEDYYAMNSDIDRIISKWFVENNCIFRKFTDGRFFAVTESKNLDNMIANLSLIHI